LQHLLDADDRVNSLVFQVDLFSARGMLPRLPVVFVQVYPPFPGMKMASMPRWLRARPERVRTEARPAFFSPTARWRLNSAFSGKPFGTIP
jgi:hypothetical protein